MNEPGSSLSSPTRLILIDSTSRAEAAHNLGVDNLPPCSITMGVATIMAARKIYLLDGEMTKPISSRKRWKTK